MKDTIFLVILYFVTILIAYPMRHKLFADMAKGLEGIKKIFAGLFIMIKARLFGRL